MKRIYKRLEEPPLLKAYREQYPDEIWEHFRRRCRKGYHEVKRAILEDQHGLCAYCEISIKFAENENEVDDFRVEHFYPKAGTNEEKHNYHLDWKNLLGVCHGGSQPDVPNPQWRFSNYKKDRSCDVPKGGKEITKRILNPSLIPAQFRLFRYAEHTGRMYVDEESCPENMRKKARNTIKELNLNAPRLMRMRKVVIQSLEDEISQNIENGGELDEVLQFLAETLLLPDAVGRTVPFFTVVRWYLGEAAERVLAAVDYKI